MKKKYAFLIFMLCLLFRTVSGNNILVSNVELAGNMVTFDLSWENSWNTAMNHDAAWIFVKYRYPSPNWQHAVLQTSGHIIPMECNLNTPADGIGVFIYRNSGTGDNNFQGIQLAWNLSANGITNTDSIQVKVFAIEMVYVPEGSFYVGDGSSTGCFRQVATNTPALISTEPIIIKCNGTSYDDALLEGSGILVDGDDGIDMLGTSSINNPNFPTGYHAFYCMKYEISQGQYADFLNTISAAQCVTRYYITTTNRYTITGIWPNLAATAPDLACNFLSWMDGCAYADWAGLRPMTELEFEKACRGPQAAVAGEYAWGNTTIFNAAYSLVNLGTSNELLINQGVYVGNASYDVTDGSLDGPLRCGIFAAGALNKNRVETGATYYGIMEMSGNVWERFVNMGTPTGRYFSGLNGNGNLNGSGNADVNVWPGNVSGAVTGAVGSGWRGAGWTTNSARLKTSDRTSASSEETSRHSSSGFRAGRSAQ